MVDGLEKIRVIQTATVLAGSMAARLLADWGAFRNVNNNATAEIIARFPNRFVGQALANPHEGMQGVRELERAIKESDI